MAKKKENFEVISICRDDIKQYCKGVNADKLTDEQMEEICEKVHTSVMEDYFWVVVQSAINDTPNLPPSDSDGDSDEKEDEDLRIDTADYGVCTLKEGWDVDASKPIYNVFDEQGNPIGSIPHYEDEEDLYNAIKEL